MTTTPPKEQRFEVTCPHCRKPFAAELMDSGSRRHTGFKCPHCRLFVAYERVDAGDGAE